MKQQTVGTVERERERVTLLENKEKLGLKIAVYYSCANKLNINKIKDELFLK